MMWIDMKGDKTYVDFHHLGGFTTWPVIIPNTSFRGYKNFIHKKTKLINIVKKKFNFFQN